MNNDPGLGGRTAPPVIYSAIAAGSDGARRREASACPCGAGSACADLFSSCSSDCRRSIEEREVDHVAQTGSSRDRSGAARRRSRRSAASASDARGRAAPCRNRRRRPARRLSRIQLLNATRWPSRTGFHAPAMNVSLPNGVSVAPKSLIRAPARAAPSGASPRSSAPAVTSSSGLPCGCADRWCRA